MKKLTHCLWFDTEAEEAAKFYTSIFKDGKILGKNFYPNTGQETHGMPAGTVMTVPFEIGGQEYLALNGGPIFKHNESFSIMVNCENQEEIDYYWEKLSEGGEKSQCGWLKDRYGISWQITPTILGEMMMDRDPERVKRVMAAFMQMQKYDIAKLRQAYEGKSL